MAHVQSYVTGVASALEEQSGVTREISAGMQVAASRVAGIDVALARWARAPPVMGAVFQHT